MTNKSDQQVIAFSAIFQSAVLVEQLARTGDIPSEALQPLVASLFRTNPNSFNDIYGQPSSQLKIGMHTLERLCRRDPKGINPNVTRYAISLLHLERKLSKKPAMLNALAEGIESSERQAHHFSELHENTIAALASLYQQTLSQLSYRIRVTGDPTHLQNKQVANKVRTLLLAGIRAAMLWRQVGGRKWQLITSRRRYLNSINAIKN